MFVYKKISDPKRDLDRVPGLTGDLRRYCRRQVYELSVYVSHSGLSAAALRVEIETNFVMHW